MSWLHNCTIIRLIHTGSNYGHTTAATARPCCQHVGSGSAMEPGNPMGVGSMGIPSSNASSGTAEILHFQVLWNTPISWDGMWSIWKYRLSSTFGNFLHLKRYWQYIQVLYLYTYKISAKIDSWTDPSKSISFQTSPLSRSIHQVCSFVWLNYIPALGKDHEDFLGKLGQLP